MRVYFDCIPCFIKQALDASRMATKDEARQEMALKRVLSELQKISFSETPPEIANKVHRAVREITKNNDPYKRVKDEYNRKALKMYPGLKQKVARSKDKLLTATKLVIAGNIIDFGIGGFKFDLEKTVRDVLVQDFTINHFNQLKKTLEKSKRIVYFGDNAGEIVFDRILLEELKNKDITFVVKEEPIINDAMVEDARFAGIDKIANIKEVSTNPKGARRFTNQLKNVDVVISKGQGNYETLSGVNANIFFLLKVKCPIIARDIGVKVGDIVIK